MYSKPSDLKTSTMKSEPGFSTVRFAGVSGASGSVSADSAAAEGIGAFPRGGGVDATWASPDSGVTSAAAPAAALTAASFRNRRRSSTFFADFATAVLLQMAACDCPCVPLHDRRPWHGQQLPI